MVKKGRLPIRVRNINPFPMTLNHFQRVANISSVSPEYIRESRDVSFTEVSPGVVEVNLVDVSEESNETSGDETGFPSIQGVGLRNQSKKDIGQCPLLFTKRSVACYRECWRER